MTIPFARRMANVRPSTIREILKVTEQPHMISFAGGLPAPELFPVADVLTATERVLRRSGASALQYGATEGAAPLRDALAVEMKGRGIRCTPDEILVTTGSQQALDLVGRVFIDPGGCVLTESPTYLAAIQAFQVYEARFVTLPTDEHGLIPDALPTIIARERPKFLYTIPNFQNPTGITLARERRQKLYEVAAEHNLLILEDDPYGKLRYSGEEIPAIKSLDDRGQVIYLSTVSKTIAPGLRVGWAVGQKDILRKMTLAKQGADLHTSSFDQLIVHSYMTEFHSAAHVETIRRAYGERFARMDAALRTHMGSSATWTHPEGGMFLWVTCPESVDTNDLMLKAVEQHVLFVPGRDFFPDASGRRYMRLNFSNSKPDQIDEGIARLASVFDAVASPAGQSAGTQ
jgi:2-aminoadipate transaminase